MTTIPSPHATSGAFSPLYDAWNRMVHVDNNTSAAQTNEYDGLNRRIVRDEGGVVRHFYYNQQWQVVEERVGSATTADKQYVYHPHYVDAIAMRIDSSGDEHYYLQDANFNVTAMVDDTGTVAERYDYTPYGEVTVLDHLYSPVSGNTSGISNEYLYTGRRLDPETGLQLNRNRFYASHLGRWVNRDPLGQMGRQDIELTEITDSYDPMIEYSDGPNLYQYVQSSPALLIDSFGLQGHIGYCNGKRYTKNTKICCGGKLHSKKSANGDPRCCNNGQISPCMPSCPKKNPDRGLPIIGDGWCDGGPAPFWHPSAWTCFRQVQPTVFAPGNQCCYDIYGDLTTGPDAGTPDLSGPAEGENPDGSCNYCAASTCMHAICDVIPGFFE